MSTFIACGLRMEKELDSQKEIRVLLPKAEETETGQAENNRCLPQMIHSAAVFLQHAIISLFMLL